MQDKTKNKIITIGFVILIFAVLLINILSKDKEISIAERRKLAQFPEISSERVLNGKAINEWEKYVEDQFIERDLFRNIKLFWNMNIFAQKDNNQLFEKENAIYKMEYPLKENNIKNSTKKIKELCKTYLKDMNIYYSIIPDKNHYLKNDDHLKIDFNEVERIVKKELLEYKYIDITNTLQLEDYYKTDLHWKQENLQDVVQIIKKNMALSSIKPNYNIENKGDFYGAYYGQLTTKVSPDKLYILTNKTIENCITYNYETQKYDKIYTVNKSSDKYDIFVSGATPLISIENPNCQSEKELLLFRDSFGSSIAPLLIENYSKITLIDLRYISSELLTKYIEFNNQDVLFLYSTLILNQNIFK